MQDLEEEGLSVVGLAHGSLSSGWRITTVVTYFIRFVWGAGWRSASSLNAGVTCRLRAELAKGHCG